MRTCCEFLAEDTPLNGPKLTTPFGNSNWAMEGPADKGRGDPLLPEALIGCLRCLSGILLVS